MGLVAERVEQLNCGSCGGAIDPRSCKPLSKIPCPHCAAPVTVPGVFDGHFLLIEPIGRGATGVVFKALDQNLHRQVAIKVLQPQGMMVSQMDSVVHEARTLAAVNHPSIVHIYSIGEYKHQHYFVMELVLGGSTADLLQNGQLLSELQMIDMCTSICEGLRETAMRGLVHMDIKPENILLNHEGYPKLIDFSATQFTARLDDVGAVGTPYYISPEVALKEAPDFRSDMYNLGATMFHLLTGHPPFVADTVRATIMRRLNYPPPSALEYRPDIHPQTAELLAHLMALDPADRFDAYGDLLAALRITRQAILEPMPGTPTPHGGLPTVVPGSHAPRIEDPGVEPSASGLVASIERPPTPMPQHPAADESAVMTEPADPIEPPTARPPEPKPEPEPEPVPEKPRIRRMQQQTPEKKKASPMQVYISLGVVVFVGLAMLVMALVVVLSGGDDRKTNQSTRVTTTGDGNSTTDGEDGGSGSGSGDPSSVAVDPPKPDDPANGTTEDPTPAPKPPTPKPPTPKPPTPKPPTPKPTPPKKKGLVGHWAFDEGKGKQTRDVVSKSTAALPTESQWIDGRKGKALLFDGQKTFVPLKHAPLATDSATFAAWIKGGPTGDFSGVIVNRDGGQTSGLAIRKDLSLAYHWANDGKATNWQSKLKIPQQTDQWIFVAAVVEPKKVTLYATDRNGKLNVVSRSHAHRQVTMKKLEVGRDAQGKDRLFKGIIDDARVYDTALDRKAIEKLISDAGKLPALAALPFDKPQPPKPPEPQVDPLKAELLAGYVALPPTEATSSNGAKLEIQEDQSIVVSGVNKGRDVYTVSFKSPGAKVTALRLEMLPHESLPANGPGRGLVGAYAIAELSATLTPQGQSATRTMTFAGAVSDVDDAAGKLENLFDNRANTQWLVKRPRGEPATVTLPINAPIEHKDGGTVTVKINNGYNLGRFRLSATASEDVNVIGADPAAGGDPASGDDGPYAKYLNVGGAAPVEAGGYTWEPAKPYTPPQQIYGFKGGANATFKDVKDPLVDSERAGITDLIFELPNGRYEVTLIFQENRTNKPKERVFSVGVEGRPWFINADSVNDFGYRKPRTLSKTVTVKDKELHIQFKGDSRLKPFINAVSVESVNLKKKR